MSESTEAHRRAATGHPQHRAAVCAVLTISDSRTIETDRSGDHLARLLTEGGHTVRARAIEPDEPERIRGRLREWLADPAINAVLTTGGTGVAPRDTTVEVVRDMLSVELDGFGELFRMISFEEIGAAAMLSRAVAGLVRAEDAAETPTVVFALPGSPNAVDTAMRRLILPELAHLLAVAGGPDG
jgi:molybdenum cofactor biosynthesis protein B